MTERRIVVGDDSPKTIEVLAHLCSALASERTSFRAFREGGQWVIDLL